MIFYVILPCISLHIIIQILQYQRYLNAKTSKKINIANISNTTDRLVTLSY